MRDSSHLENRKTDHIDINLNKDVRSSITTGLECYRFVHNALPELDLGKIDLAQPLFNKILSIPVIISSMTGGTEDAYKINRTLSQAAQATGAAMGLGSQRAAIENGNVASTFQIRKFAPDILLFANLGAIQLNYGYGLNECMRAVEMIEADALILHLNPLQEALQPEGDINFSGLTKKIGDICKRLKVPVIIKEVGWGISKDVALRLKDCGVTAIDVAGAGGTSWSQVEMHRIQDRDLADVAASFRGWGIPTAESIIEVREATPGMKIIASGGLRGGLDIAKCIALGASAGALASIFLKSAVESLDKTIESIQRIQREIQVTMFSIGAANINELQNAKMTRNDDR